MSAPTRAALPPWLTELKRSLERSVDAPLSHRYKSPVSPALSYGRHRGPIPKTSRRAAVLIAIEQSETATETEFGREDAHIILTRRPTALKHHGGQICLPGGQVEAGEGSLEAALREFREELGSAADVIHSIGRLSTQYVYASDNRVVPHVVWMRHARRPWRPDPAEVDQVLEVRLTALLGQFAGDGPLSGTETKKIRRAEQIAGYLKFAAPGFSIDNSHIWGATAMILDELAYHLHEGRGAANRPAN